MRRPSAFHRLDLIGIQAAATSGKHVDAGRVGGAGDDDIVRIEPQVEGDKRHEAAQEQPGGGQEHQGARDLPGGQHRLSEVRPPVPEATGRRRARIVECPDQIGARPGECRGGAEREDRPRSTRRSRRRARFRRHPTWSSSGTRRGTIVDAARMIPAVTARPSAPPARLRTTLSVSSLADNPAGPRAEGAADGEFAPARTRRRAAGRPRWRRPSAAPGRWPRPASGSASRNGRARSSRNEVTRVLSPKPGGRRCSSAARSEDRAHLGRGLLGRHPGPQASDAAERAHD